MMMIVRGPGRNAERNFHREKRSNETHQSTTDPEARLYKKGDGQPAKLCYMGHALMENRHGLAVGGGISQATGTAERETALELIDGRGRARRRITLGADKAYDVTQFVHDLRDRSVTPPHRDRRASQQDRQAAQDGGRPTHHPTCRLRHQPALPQTHRRGVRLDQEFRRSGQGEAARARPGGRGLYAGAHGLQSDPHAQTAGSRGVKDKSPIVMPDYTANYADGDEANFTARPCRTSSTAC